MFYNNYDSLPAGVYQSFISRPDLHPPILNVNGTGTPGLVLFSQSGDDVHQPACIISDHNGNIVYVHTTPDPAGCRDLNLQTYNGTEYLTFWSGEQVHQHFSGTYYIMDNTLNITNYIETDPLGDMHEFNIVNNTALAAFYYPLAMDLTKWGGPANGRICGSGFKQVDLYTGEVIFDWKSTDHFTPDVSIFTIKEGSNVNPDGSPGPWDIFHLNSIDMHPTDGARYFPSR